MSTLDTVPASVEMATGEVIPFNIDTTPVMIGTDTLQVSPAPTAKVVSLATNVTVTGAVSGVPSVSGNVIQTTVLGSALVRQQSYYLIVTFNSNATKVLQLRLQINVLF